jgi:hypothetical protein
MSSEEFDKTMVANYDSLIRHINESKLHLYVSCWHVNEHESGAMWKLYTTMQEAICIRTSYARLGRALPDEVFLGLVRYLDYDNDVIDFGNGLNYIMHKRLSFAHEREARAAIWTRAAISSHRYNVRAPVNPPGFGVKVDLNEIIQEVYVSPASKPPLLDTITALINDYGLRAPVKQSEVNAGPAY